MPFLTPLEIVKTLNQTPSSEMKQFLIEKLELSEMLSFLKIKKVVVSASYIMGNSLFEATMKVLQNDNYAMQRFTKNKYCHGFVSGR